MRDTLAAIFASLGVLSFAALVLAGSLDVPDAIPLLVVAAIVGQIAGRGLFARMRPETYEPVVLGVLVCAAGVAVLSAFI
jgi:uncharacterized membrane protein YfcA